VPSLVANPRYYRQTPMHHHLWRLSGVLALLLGGCAGQISEMPTWVAFDEDNVEGADDVAVVLLKVEPAAQVLLAAGRIEGDGWRSGGSQGQVWLPAKDGFVVARVTPTQEAMAYAVVGLRADALGRAQDGAPLGYEAGFWSAVPTSAPPGSGGAGMEYVPTRESRIPLCTAVAGRVTFVGALRVLALAEPGGTEAPPKIGVTPVASPDDLEAAKRYLGEHYPKVKARVVERPLQMMRRSDPKE
jgi:hypothetical protein